MRYQAVSSKAGWIIQCTKTYRVVAQGLCEYRAKAKANELNGVK